MIQELLNGSGLIPGETKFSTSSHHLHHHHHHNNPPPGVFSPLITTTSSHTSLPPIPPPSSTATTTTTSAATSANSDNHQNLRCPRCDSSNTKFCYYNNYNLTQPRHFCKTCRRYWTKGGALRNVPIGGGCRKNRSVGGSAVKTSVAKIKTAASPSEMLGAGAGFREHDPNNPILWGSPQSSHVLALLRAGQSPNPNPNPNPSLPISMNKEEGKNLMVSHNTTVTEPVVGSVLVHGRALDFDSSSLGNNQFPTLGLCSSIWRGSSNINGNSINNQDGFLVGEVVHDGNSGIQELYQRLRSSSSSANYCSDINSSAQVLRNMASSTTTSSLSTNLGSASVVSHGDDQLGYTWNPTPSWFDLSATNGTLYP